MNKKQSDIEQRCIEIKHQCGMIENELDKGQIVSAYKRVLAISKTTESLMLRNRQD